MLLLALGSRGDVQPMAALGGALARRGVDARVVALRDYAGLVGEEGAGFVPVDASLADAIDATRTPLGRLATGSAAGQGWLLRRWCGQLAEPVADAVLGAARPGEAVLAGVLARDVATALAEASGGRRVATVVFTGQVPTQQADSHFFRHWFGRSSSWNRWGTHLNWRVSTNLGSALGLEVRRRLGLPAVSGRVATASGDRHPTIVAASPTLVPPASDWPRGVHQTGYLAPRDLPFEPDADLAAFLAGDPPAYVGFGSLTGSSGHASLDVVAEAARRSGRRVVTPVLPGGRPGRVGDHLHAVGPVPFAWLFPRCAAVVHHGGAGTTQEGLRAGVPSAAVPFGVDQPYHAWRLARLGVGPEPVPIRRLGAASLAGLLSLLTEGTASAGFRVRAAELGAAVRAEDGVGRTVALLDRLGLA